MNNKPTFKWTFEDFDSEKQNGFQVLIDNDYNLSDIDFDSGEQNTATEQWNFPTGTDYTELPDGIWYWKVRTKDPDGIWTEFSNPRKILIDTQIPTSAPDFPENNGYYNNVQRISGKANDVASGSGLNRIEITIQRLKDNNYWNGTNWVSLHTWITAIGTSDWIYYLSEVDWTSGTRYSIRSRAIDNANNVEETTNANIFTIDNDDPISTIETPIDKIWLNELNTISSISHDISGSGVLRVEISIKCSEDYIPWDTGPKKNHYWSGTAWTPNKAWLLTTGTTKWSYDTSEISWTTVDEYNIQSRAIDNTNNIEIPEIETTFRYDGTPPEDLEIIINNNVEYISSTSANLSLQAEDIGSGISEMSFSTDSMLWFEWEPFNISRPFELPAGDGKKTIYFRVRDFTGNIAESAFDSIILDTTPPEELSIVIDENSKYTNSRDVKINIQCTDKLSGIGEVSFCYNGLDWFDWEYFTQTKYLTFPNDITDGENKIYFRAKDNVGNIADFVFDSIILDTLPPFSLSIMINDGSHETNSTLVTIALQAIDNTSGVSRISFSDDGVSWNDWKNFKELIYFDLSPGNGEKTIYVKISDKAGNIVGPISDKIILNMTAPQKDVQTKDTPSSGLNFWIIMFIFAIVLFIIIIIGIVIIKKRKKSADQDILQPGALTIRPGGLSGPIISMGKIPKAIDQPQLPSAIEPTGSQGINSSSGITPTPMLAKSTQISQINIPQPTMKLPVLPPAKPLEKELEVNATIQTPVPTVVSPPSTPTIATIPTTSPGPVVHIPESKPQPTLENSTQPKPQTKNTNQITQQED
jgi:hypothetical protein